jgi:hypothetical protein
MPDMRREYRSGKVGCYSNRERSCCKCKGAARLIVEPSEVALKDTMVNCRDEIRRSGHPTPFLDEIIRRSGKLNLEEEDYWMDSEKIKYNNWDSSTLREISVHPKEFMVLLQNNLADYSNHLALREMARIQKILRSRNMRPHQMVLNMDFIENLSFNIMKNAVQGNHWKNEQVTILSLVASHLWDSIGV